jgi:hypothetical protein
MASSLIERQHSAASELAGLMRPGLAASFGTT